MSPNWMELPLLVMSAYTAVIDMCTQVRNTASDQVLTASSTLIPELHPLACTYEKPNPVRAPALAYDWLVRPHSYNHKAV